MTDDTAQMVAWLRSVVEGDLRAAKAAAEKYWPSAHDIKLMRHAITNNAWLTAEAEFVARHDPVDVIADCEAKLAVLDEHPSYRNSIRETVCRTCATEDYAGDLTGEYPCRTLRLLAYAYRHRPGWREEWKL